MYVSKNNKPREVGAYCHVAQLKDVWHVLKWDLLFAY